MSKKDCTCLKTNGDYRYLFEIDTKPVVKKRPRFSSRGRVWTPKPTKDFEDIIDLRLKEQMAGEPPLSGPVRVSLHFYFARPESHFKKDGSLRKGKPTHFIHAKSGDVDNYAKAVLDAANEIVYDDDCQVLDLRCTKQYSDDNISKIIMGVEPI